MSIVNIQKRISEFNGLQKNLCYDIIDEIRNIIDKYGKDGKIVYSKECDSSLDVYTIVGDGVDAMEANLIICGATNFENGDVGVLLRYNDGDGNSKVIGDDSVILSKDDLRSTFIYYEDIIKVLYSLLEYVDFIEWNK